MRRPRLPNMIGACAFLCGLLALPPHAVSQTLPPLDSLPPCDTDIDDLEVQSVAAYVWKMSHPEAGDSLPPPVTPGMVERGEHVFLGAGGCALCHGTEATGLLGPDLTDGEWLDAKGSYLAIGRIVVRGVPLAESTRGVEMPPRGGSDISAADIERVAAYVWYMSHRE